MELNFPNFQLFTSGIRGKVLEQLRNIQSPGFNDTISEMMRANKRMEP